MANYTVDKDSMLKPAAVNDPGIKFQWLMLGSDKWKYDRGLFNAIASAHGERKAMYYFTDKRGKRLWDLMLNMETEVCTTVAKYYGLLDPEYFMMFLRFVYNDVASHISWKCPAKMDQMDLFPYKDLHDKWAKEILYPALERSMEKRMEQKDRERHEEQHQERRQPRQHGYSDEHGDYPPHHG